MTAVMGSTEAAMAVAKEAMDRVARSPYVSAVPGGTKKSCPIVLEATSSASVVEQSRHSWKVTPCLSCPWLWTVWAVGG